MKFHLSNFLSHIETGTKFPVSILQPKWITPEPLSLQKISQIIIQQKESEGLSLESANTIATNWTVGMKPHRASLVDQMVKNLPAVQETCVGSLGQEDPLEKGMAIHSLILCWRIPWTEEPGGLQSIGLQKLRHDCAINTHTHTHTHTHVNLDSPFPWKTMICPSTGHFPSG